jgi:hypothetical protein
MGYYPKSKYKDSAIESIQFWELGTGNWGLGTEKREPPTASIAQPSAELTALRPVLVAADSASPANTAFQAQNGPGRRGSRSAMRWYLHPHGAVWPATTLEHFLFSIVARHPAPECFCQETEERHEQVRLTLC